jgi:hypothetical protein
MEEELRMKLTSSSRSTSVTLPLPIMIDLIFRITFIGKLTVLEDQGEGKEGISGLHVLMM